MVPRPLLLLPGAWLGSYRWLWCILSTPGTFEVILGCSQAYVEPVFSWHSTATDLPPLSSGCIYPRAHAADIRGVTSPSLPREYRTRLIFLSIGGYPTPCDVPGGRNFLILYQWILFSHIILYWHILCSLTLTSQEIGVWQSLSQVA